MKRKSTRQILIDEDLLSLKDNILVSARNINIIEDYISGMTLEETGRKYQISKERVRAIAANYIAHCHQYLRKGYSMKSSFTDIREQIEKYNTIDTALKNDSELLTVSESIKNKAIYCHQFIISERSRESLKNNRNYIIGTGIQC